jgi:hypothetical protein
MQMSLIKFAKVTTLPTIAAGSPSVIGQYNISPNTVYFYRDADNKVGLYISDMGGTTITRIGNATTSGSSTVSVSTLSFNGDTLANTTGTARWYPHIPVTVSSGYASIGTASTADITADIRVNGVSKGTIVLPANAHRSTNTTLNIPLLTTDFVTANITASDGQDLSINLIYS